MTVQQFYDYCKGHDCLDYEMEIYGEYYHDVVRFEEVNGYFPTATVDNDRKVVWLDAND